MIEQLIAEATECDFKVALETKKPKSWLKSVSAFSNGIGGTLFFGVSDDREPIGLSDVQKDAEAISRLIKERITPLPQFILKPLQEDGKNLLALEVSSGRSTPYYYKADGVMEAYIRVGNESVIAPDYIVNELILKGTNQSFDTLTTEAVKKDYSFTLLEATYNTLDFAEQNRVPTGMLAPLLETPRQRGAGLRWRPQSVKRFEAPPEPTGETSLCNPSFSLQAHIQTAKGSLHCLL